jgi:hypothetical protein
MESIATSIFSWTAQIVDFIPAYPVFISFFIYSLLASISFFRMASVSSCMACILYNHPGGSSTLKDLKLIVIGSYFSLHLSSPGLHFF